jgi:hypothetical protein
MAQNDDKTPTCDCGPLAPQSGEKPIPPDATPDKILAQVMLACDDQTGVFFFRYNNKLYMRTVEAE